VVEQRVAQPRSYLEIPREWEQVAVRRVGAFVTSETFRRPDGRLVTWVGYEADALTFFVGSLFFTSAALLQYIEVTVAPRTAGAVERSGGPPRLGIEPRRIDWWAVAVQVVGTVYFNVTTFAALNLAGSVAFGASAIERTDTGDVPETATRG
jgi:hypothetical protein